MTNRTIWCLSIAALVAVVGVAASGWAIYSKIPFLTEEMKSRRFERRLQSDELDHAAILSACERMMESVGTNAIAILLSANTPPDDRIPPFIQDLDPVSIIAATNWVDISWSRQLGSCGLVYLHPGADTRLEIEKAKEADSLDPDEFDSVISEVSDRVYFYSIRWKLLGY